jgi:hypothetical protein
MRAGSPNVLRYTPRSTSAVGSSKASPTGGQMQFVGIQAVRGRAFVVASVRTQDRNL